MANKTALITGASRGLGLALAHGLAARGWSLLIDARNADALDAAATALSAKTAVRAVSGDVTDPAHRAALADAARELGGLDALVNNAGALGPSPQPGLLDYPLDALAEVYASNVFAPLGVIQATRDLLKPGAAVVNITSDAGVEGYPGWGGYGSSKAALEQLSRVLAAEQPGWRVYWVDPGDMRTQMHQDAFPGEDISDRPLPDVSVPGLVALIEGAHPSGRYKAQSVGQEKTEKPQGWLNLVLTTADYERTVAFYRDGLGYPVLERWDETGHGVMLDIGRATLEIADAEQAAEVDRIETGRVNGAPVRLALRVPDSRTAAENLTAFGATIVADVVQTPWKHINRRVIGPDSMPITLFQTSED
jgi:NAD(P)-dependent dehydrogenase (short-subunit alcohol dehydrogenase family)